MAVPSGEREYRLRADDLAAGRRLDAWIAEKVAEMSRAAIQRLIRRGECVVDGTIARPAHRLKPGEIVQLRVPPVEPSEIEPEDLPITVLYQDDAIAVIDKPAGMVVHPGAGVRRGTLVSTLLHHLPGLRGVGGVERPGIVHRLDKGTSGVMIVAKTDQALASLQAQFQARTVKKTYAAVVWGHLPHAEGTIALRIGRSRGRATMTTRARRSKEALTRYEVRERLAPWCELVHAYPATGRTHQIRVHLAAVGHPVVGDPAYGRGSRKDAPRFVREFARPALHARRIEFLHPVTGMWVEFEAKLPADLEALIAALRNLAPQPASRQGRV